MKTCICTTPIRPVPTRFPPMGSMAIIQALRKIGIDSAFYNIDYFRPPKERVEDYFRTNQFGVVGISAVVSTAYAYTKWLAAMIRRVSPNTIIVLGGNMAASAEILLRKCEVDICVVGDGEYIAQDLFKRLQEVPFSANRQAFADIKGISYIDENAKFRFTGFGRRPSSEEIEYPDYRILEADGSLPHFIFDTVWTHRDASPRHIARAKPGSKSAIVTAAKGCVARCTFCHRWEKGYRPRPVEAVIEHIQHLQARYGVNQVTIADENFGADRKLTRELVVELGKLGIDWSVGGVRARTVNASDLQLWADNGCLVAYFGIEAGSEKILEIMEKQATVQENINALKWTGEAGIATIIQLVIGMPGENDETIRETIDFLKRVSGFMLDWKKKAPSELISINYAQALPGTPLYEFARETGYIKKSIDGEEHYLLKISDTDAYNEDHFVNYTGLPLLKVLMWRQIILAEIDAFHFQNQKTIQDLSLLQVIGYYYGLLSIRAKRRLGKLRLYSRSDHGTPPTDAATDEVRSSGYFNIHTNLKFAPLLLNRWTRLAFYPLLALAVAFWRAGSLLRAVALLSEHAAWSIGLIKRTTHELPKKSLRKVIALQKIPPGGTSADQMVPLRLGR